MGAAARSITTSEATLTTAVVEIQVLSLNNKQMTLAVARQLPIRKETTESQDWGIVRYAIKDEGDVWLVFSEDGKLYRRSVIPYSLRVPGRASNLRYAQEQLVKFESSRDWLERESEILKWHRQTVNERHTDLLTDLHRAQVAIQRAVHEDEIFTRRENQLNALPQLFIAV